jgi:hypothetical protein
MQRQRIQEIVSILMESCLYFDMPVGDRLNLIRGLAARVSWQ